jgi:hypothetical protein
VTLVPPNSNRGGYPLGLAGATAASRYVGATAAGAPVAGTFAVGDFVIDQTGVIYICTVAGTPGTWVQVGGSSALTWTNVTGGVGFGAGFADFGSGFGQVAYAKDVNFVYLRGVASGTSANATVFTLPAGYRPAAKAILFPGLLFTSAPFMFALTTGVIQVGTGGTDFSAVDFDGMSFALG